mmetsp:Transcript_20394/g.18532  ORF Transcript_20394/g.18532 Transcript_20394/m.18532 type:complete len:84 (+) Transcript_20394:88-339(+)
MGFSLYNLFKAGLLLTNAVAILHPKRFLAKYGLDKMTILADSNDGGNALKSQLAGLLQAVAYLKIPLITINSLVIIIEILVGG